MTESLDQLDDQELARWAQAGCESSFEELVRRFQVPLMRFLLRRMGRQHDAEDVLQETFVRAYQKLHLYDARYAFRPWLYTIACRTASRHRGSSVATFADPGLFATPHASALDSMVHEEERQTLWGLARRELTDGQFAALWMFHVEQFSAGQIATALGRSWASVKTMLHRARKKLMIALAAPPAGRAQECDPCASEPATE